MEYVKGVPYFVAENEKMKAYPYLDADVSCEILIIGGGVDGAVANYFLSPKYDVVLVESSRLGFGATSLATSLLEYQLDDFADELKSYLSQEEIVRVYEAGIYGIDKMERLVKSLKINCHFKRKASFLYSNCFLDRSAIKKEFEFRIKNGFPCDLITQTNSPFSFNFDMGILCPNGGAEIDPYLFEKALILNSSNQDRIFENTKINEIKKCGDKFECQTAFGNKIYCKEVILATGFNFDLAPDADRLCTRYVSYSIVVSPLWDMADRNNALVQDCLEPYHYMRFLPDEKIIYGGEDTLMKGSISSKKAEKAYRKLYTSLQKMFPIYKTDICIEYKFCGAFGTTKNNLGIIGRDQNGVINFFSCGANGIINSMFGIEIVENILNRTNHPLEKLFSPLRK